MRKFNPLPRLQLRTETIRKLTQLGTLELVVVHGGDPKSPGPCTDKTGTCGCQGTNVCG